MTALRVVVVVAAAIALVPSCGSAAGARGTTNMTFSPSHGTQIEFLAADGRSRLWYPGNTVVLPGAWRLAPVRTPIGMAAGICFRYPASSYNPSTGSVGGAWECEALASYQAGIVDQAAGDPFGLGSRSTVPFALAPQRTTIADLMGRR